MVGGLTCQGVVDQVASLVESSFDPVDCVDCVLLYLVDLCEQLHKLRGVVMCRVPVFLVVVVGYWFVCWFVRGFWSRFLCAACTPGIVADGVDEALAVPAHTFAFLPGQAGFPWVEVLVVDNVIERCRVRFLAVALLVILGLFALRASVRLLLRVVSTISLR